MQILFNYCPLKPSNSSSIITVIIIDVEIFSAVLCFVSYNTLNLLFSCFCQAVIVYSCNVLQHIGMYTSTTQCHHERHYSVLILVYMLQSNNNKRIQTLQALLRQKHWHFLTDINIYTSNLLSFYLL